MSTTSAITGFNMDQDPAALALLAKNLHEQARYAEAEAVFARLAELQPGEALHWMNLGTARRCTGDTDGALRVFAHAAELGAATGDFYFNVALAHIQRSDFESARALLRKALELLPADLEVRYHYAQCCFERHHTDEALAVLADWERYATAGDPVNANIGQLLLLLGELARAEQAIRLAAAGPGSTLESRLKLVQLFERTNRLAEARAQLDQLLADPRSAQLGADLLLTQAHMAQREGQHSLASQLFRNKLAACKELHDEHSDLYPLARSLDALGQYEEAFDTLLRAHRSQRAYLKRSAPLAVLRGAPMMVIAERGCDPADVLKWDERDGPAAAESPIFIVAFPRSGTTLLELALDAHPLLKSMDEQPFLQNALDDLSATGARYPTQLGRLSRSELDGVRSRYWERVHSKIKLAPGQRLVDKNPLNLLRLPVIKRLFPHTQVLVAIRHPCDVLLSCFMQHFRAPEFALLCQSLPMLAAGYRKAFEFWYEQQSILRAQVLELHYESFVADFETWIRAVVAFLELPWNDAVLAPGKRAQDKRYISTPSYSQVVLPITGKAVGRWQNYRHHFSQVLPVVQPLLDRWHYDA